MSSYLFIDTSCPKQWALLIHQGQGTRLYWHQPRPMEATQSLLAGIDELLRMDQCQYQDLAAIMVATGPGNLTGLRVGLALVQGLVVSLSCPLLALPTFDWAIAALQCKGYDRGMVAMHLRAVGLYAQSWPDGQAGLLSDRPNNQPCFFLGDWPEGLEAKAYPSLLMVEPLAEACLMLFQQREQTKPEALDAVYVVPPV